MEHGVPIQDGEQGASAGSVRGASIFRGDGLQEEWQAWQAGGKRSKAPKARSSWWWWTRGRRLLL